MTPNATFAFYPLQDRRSLTVRLLHGVSSSFEQVASAEEWGTRQKSDSTCSRPRGLWGGRDEEDQKRTQTNGRPLVTVPGVRGVVGQVSLSCDGIGVTGRRRK